MAHEWRHGKYIISTDKTKLDLNTIHGYLSQESYWAAGIPCEIVKRSIENSLAFGIYTEDWQQVGFARVITDYATFAYICDVFVLEPFRGQGLSKWLLDVMNSLPELQGFRCWLLGTKDAHGLYRKIGFTELPDPKRYMRRMVPDIYKNM